jgi:hydroxymethylpyrimidine/phosphomethylpyrimidine kinase
VPPPIALTIAGSDPSGGAGIQADLKTFHQHGVYGTAVVTLLTAQNTRGVARVEVLDPALVLAQLEVLLDDLSPQAAKTGALGSAAIVTAIGQRARRFEFPLVVDPVMVSKHGAPLLSDDAREAIVRELLPVATLVTPNAHEAAVLVGEPVRTLAEARRAARALVELGAHAALVKGGHLDGPPVDVLATASETLEIPAERIETLHTHGTGCTYSAAITASLAQGLALEEAVRRAKAWLTEALRRAPGIGHGVGPVDHFAPLALARSERAKIGH